MAQLGRIAVTGSSGAIYKFRVFQLETQFKTLPGVYFFVNRTERPDGSYAYARLIYVGQTEDLSPKVANHPLSIGIVRHAANCVCIHLEENAWVRKQTVTDLISAYRPWCNNWISTARPRPD